MKPRLLLIIVILALTGQRAFSQEVFRTAPHAVGAVPDASARDSVFPEEFTRTYTNKDGVPSDDVRAIVIAPSGDVYAGTARGLARFSAGKWATVAADGEPVEQVAAAGDDVWFTSAGKLVHLHGLSYTLPAAKINQITAAARPLVATDAGLYQLNGKKFAMDIKLARFVGSEQAIRQVAVAADGRVALAAAEGLFVKQVDGAWSAVYPRNSQHSWAPYNVRSVAFDSKGRLWFCSPQGVGYNDTEWHLFTGTDGLPYEDFTALATGENGTVWFGTPLGAIRYDGRVWEYRQGRRWLPGDTVRSIAVNANGDAWFATTAGIGVIERRPTTLAAKAKFFEDEIDQRHRRTPYGYIDDVSLNHPGDTSEWQQSASDDDGLRTALYGAGECFAYAATLDPLAKQRARAAFEALRFLGAVTQGGPHPAPRGFIARSILPASGPDPNRQDSPQRDEQVHSTQDAAWKSITPRWPMSADGKWYWQSDTSPADLDGHFFFYALYFDLVADTEDERHRVREQVAAIAAHLIDHHFQLIDHDGKPTRWGVFSPENLNQNFAWRDERGQNSLRILTYLKVAAHITGDPRFAAAARWLIEQHDYAANTLIPGADSVPGSGRQSDDGLTFINFYNLIRYETDPNLKETYATALCRQWNQVRPELNPFFDLTFAASCSGQTSEDAFGKQDLSPQDNGWLQESMDTLQRFPLDRIDWHLINSHRTDIIRLPAGMATGRTAGAFGQRVNGNALPVDERWVGHWNDDPWELDEGGNGTTLADGGPFLLPYYMGLYLKYIRE